MISALAIETQAPVPAVGEPRLVARPMQPVQGTMRSDTPSQDADAAPAAEDLMAAIAERRDRKAFVELFERLGPRVKGYLMRQGADRETAEDLTQDVMLTVWHRAAQFDRKKAAVSTWVFTIARNRRIDRLRRARRPEFDPEDPALVSGPEQAADTAVEVSQRSERLHAAVAQLPAEQEKLLRLAYFEDKSHSLIAEELSLPLGTVKSRLRLAMAKLRAALESLE